MSLYPMMEPKAKVGQNPTWRPHCTLFVSVCRTPRNMSHLKRPVEETLAEKLAVKNKKTIQRQPPRNPHAQENANAKKTLTKTTTKTPTILAHAHI